MQRTQTVNRIRSGIAVVLLCLAWLVAITFGQGVTRAIMFGTNNLVGLHNLGTSIFDGGVLVILIGVAWLSGRRHERDNRVRLVVLVAGLVAVGIGVTAGLNYHGVREPYYHLDR